MHRQNNDLRRQNWRNYLRCIWLYIDISIDIELKLKELLNEYQLVFAKQEEKMIN